MEESGLCGIERAIRNIVGYMEEGLLCGVVWAVRNIESM